VKDSEPVRRFIVGVAARGGIRAGGHLAISPGAVVCELGRVGRRVAEVNSVRHRGDLVHIYKARLVPPWCNVSAVIDDGENALLVSMWSLGLKALTEALTAAGFRVEVHRTWFFRGLHFSEILRGAREPQTGVSSPPRNRTRVERVLAARRALAIYCALAVCMSGLVAWLGGGLIAGGLAAAFGALGAGATLWASRSIGRARHE
jgi:hypothetical protein